MNDAKPAIIAGVRDTLIVAANNPVSHGGLNGLQQIMRAQAERLRNIEQPGSSVQEYRRGLMDAQNALQTVANRHRSKTAVRAMQELLSKLISLYGEGAPAPAAEQGRIAVVDEPGCIARAALDTLARSGVVQNEARGVEGILSQEDCPICQRFADKFGPCGYHKRIAAAPEPVRVDGAK